MNDFNICINLDEKHQFAYFERAKLLFSNDQASKGLEDLKKLKELSPHADAKLHECCLFYIIEEYDLAESCLPSILDDDKRNQLEVLLNLKQLRITSARSKMSGAADQMICDIIMGKYPQEEVSAEDLEYFNRVEYYNYLGIKDYYQNDLEEAINNLNLALKEKSLMDLEENIVGSVEEEGQENEESNEGTIESETKPNELHYLNFNLFLLLLANKDRKKAYEVFIRDLLPAKEYFLRSDQVSSLSRLLFQTMKVKESEPEVPASSKKTYEFVLFRSLLGESADFIEIELPNFILVLLPPLSAPNSAT